MNYIKNADHIGLSNFHEEFSKYLGLMRDNISHLRNIAENHNNKLVYDLDFPIRLELAENQECLEATLYKYYIHGNTFEQYVQDDLTVVHDSLASLYELTNHEFVGVVTASIKSLIDFIQKNSR